jgi:hypothetical protein
MVNKGVMATGGWYLYSSVALKNVKPYEIIIPQKIGFVKEKMHIFSFFSATNYQRVTQKCRKSRKIQICGGFDAESELMLN